MHTLWSDLAESRRQLVESHALDHDPFLSRLWHFYLRWPGEFLKIAATTKAEGLGWALRRRYCRIADRLFGGTREDQYCEKLDRDNERRLEKVRQLRKQLQENEERRFNRELEHHALTNPNFVVTPRTHQDQDRQ